MVLAYYPGCTLKREGRQFESSALASMEALDLSMKEIKRWNCCGTVHSLSDDDLFHKVAPIRNLVRAEQEGADKVVTLCAMCLHTLKLANKLVRDFPDKLATINAFMDREPDYSGQLEVVHMLEVLRDDVGFDKVRKSVQRPLTGLSVAPYYGCLLNRPKDGAIDDLEEPRVMHDLLEALGATVVDDPLKTECCGSYQIIDNKSVVMERTEQIISSMGRRGADILALSCPLCDYNLEKAQKALREMKPGFREIPVVYFTQLMALALGLDEDVCMFDAHTIDPRPILREKGILRPIHEQQELAGSEKRASDATS